MENAKKIIALLFVFVLAFTLFSCGYKSCTTCVDENEDGVCDVCKKDMPDSSDGLLLIDGGYADFQFVTPRSLSSSVREALKKDVVKVLNEKLQAEVDVIIEGSEFDEEMEIEVLVGDVTTRGDDYKFDRHTLGKDGYVIRLVGKKIIINAGSDEALVLAIEEFADKILGIDEDEISDVTMTSDDNILEIQDDYDVTSLAVNGTDMKGYTIAADLSTMHYQLGTANIQDAFYEETGYWFEIVDVTEATDRSIVVRRIEKTSGDDSFRIYASGSQLIIECAFDNMLDRATLEFIEQEIGSKSGNVNLMGELFKKDISVVYYEDFGAVGDGFADDFEAIYNTHRFANECGQTVKATAGKTYYIFDTTLGTENVYHAHIRTNVDWCGASFIIDDTRISSVNGGEYYKLSSKDIFVIEPDSAHQVTKIIDSGALSRILEDGLNPSTTRVNLDINWDGAVMIIPYNSAHKVFRRRGYTGFAGAAMHEVIIIESNGSVSKETPIMFDYTALDYIEVYRLDPTSAITIENGRFITWESRIDCKSSSGYDSGNISRGISVKRSYTTLKNIEHTVTGGFTLLDRVNGGREGSSCTGFFRASYANNVTFKDCIIPGRTSYNGQSTYNFNANCVNKMLLDGCVQPNFWVTIDPETYEVKNATLYDENAIGKSTKGSQDAVVGMGFTYVEGTKIRLCWGVGATNYCKNLEYLNSTLSRFDAHSGLYNGKVINCNVNDMELTGFGDFILENSNWYPYTNTTPLLFLRSDYGYHWEGDILIKDTKAHLYSNSSSPLVNHKYSNWYFGYTAAFPNITVDNLDLYNAETGKALPTGYRVTLFNFQTNAKRMHLSDSGVRAYFCAVDEDKDGYIDEPLYDRNLDGKMDESDRFDIDGDGNIGNTKLRYDDYSGYRSGVSISGCTVNLNVTKPPKYIKVINNNGVNGVSGYFYVIKDTSGEEISDGGWWNEDETFGGFFGDTKFIYGEGENDYLTGTAEKDPSKTFVFISAYE